tara:strand:+ start:1240 stop:1782 length:543 start_codon:yes stop_codon:yes gene_type:complete
MIQEKINKRIVLAGGPSTGKTSVIDELSKLKFKCFDEAARDILSDYKQKGLEFKSDPIKISEEILERRHNDFKKGSILECKDNVVFYDRGIHEITAYLRSINQSTSYWDNLPSKYKYDLIFIFQPWKKIYQKDRERTEEFSDLEKISPFIINIYMESGIKIIEVPNISIKERVKYILDNR